MADNILPHPTQARAIGQRRDPPVADRSAPVLTADRIELALEANWQAEACATAAIRTLDQASDSTDPFELQAVLRALTLRLRCLDRIAIRALDAQEPADDLRRELTGELTD